MTAGVREAFPGTKPVSNTAYGPGIHSDAMKQVVVVGLYSRQKMSKPWPSSSALVDRRSMLGNSASWPGGSCHDETQEKRPLSRVQRIEASA